MGVLEIQTSKYDVKMSMLKRPVEIACRACQNFLYLILKFKKWSEKFKNLIKKGFFSHISSSLQCFISRTSAAVPIFPAV